jgi:hypothetical protein
LRLTVSLAALAGGLIGASCAQAQTGPDLSGTWTNASITDLTRRASQPLVVDEAEAARIASGDFMVRQAQAEQRGDVPNLADGNTQLGYNSGWMDGGSSLARVNGEYRTSWLVEPADGQLPLTEEGRTAQRIAAGRQRSTDNPEEMAPNDRCLIASRGTGGPGMLNNLYNNSYEFVQTDDELAIVVEMVHDVRIIPFFDSKAAAQTAHRPAALHPWLGDSVGWWDGETLVVETVNVHPDQGAYGPIFLSPDGKVTERFTRVADDEIFYAFEVEDPVYYTQAWRAEMSLRAMDGRLYEYACHEGNYALEGMLSGARAEEAAAISTR